MAKFSSLPTICFLLIVTIFLGLANSARLLDEATLQFTPPDELPALPPVDGSSSTPAILPSGQAPAATDDPPADTADTPAPIDDLPTATAAAPAADDGPTTTADAPEATADAPTVDEVPTTAAPAAVPEDSPANTAQGGTAGSGPGGAGGTPEHPGHPAITFFMHDVLGGSAASGRIVTGLIATSDVNGIPFSRPNNQVFPVTNGVPLINNGNINNLLNNNNVPFLAGLSGQNQPQAQTIIQNAGTNSVVNGGDDNQAFVTAGNLPTGAALQKFLFGSITVIDDELTESHELGAGVIGRGQGFYLASSLDGESHTMAFTALFHGGEHDHDEDDTLSFFGVHRTASPISQIAIIGGTGKYENAMGYAVIETIPMQDQHTTDGVDTVAKFTVYLY